MIDIFQQFNLCEEELEKLTNEEIVSRNFPQAAKSLIEKLQEKGYQVLESNKFICGIPSVIILGGDHSKGLNHKRDFYELAARLNLPFMSGPFYLEAKPR